MKKERGSDKHMIEAMVKAGVIKVVGHRLEDGQVVPVYDAVPVED